LARISDEGAKANCILSLLNSLLVAVYLFINTNIKTIEAIGKHIKLRKLQYFLFVREYNPREILIAVITPHIVPLTNSLKLFSVSEKNNAPTIHAGRIIINSAQTKWASSKNFIYL
jgi:hypothetical protein